MSKFDDQASLLLGKSKSPSRVLDFDYSGYIQSEAESKYLTNGSSFQQL
jgi:hypothetical protein